MTTEVSSLCTVLDTGILLGNNSALCHSTAQHKTEDNVILLATMLLPALGKCY